MSAGREFEARSGRQAPISLRDASAHKRTSPFKASPSQISTAVFSKYPCLLPFRVLFWTIAFTT